MQKTVTVARKNACLVLLPLLPSFHSLPPLVTHSLTLLHPPRVFCSSLSPLFLSSECRSSVCSAAALLPISAGQDGCTRSARLAHATGVDGKTCRSACTGLIAVTDERQWTTGQQRIQSRRHTNRRFDIAHQRIRRVVPFVAHQPAVRLRNVDAHPEAGDLQLRTKGQRAGLQ